ncbi:MAG: metallophosphoesterase [Clostridia bacterium]|nr:metallophosphoesterase [Clostridia bacterium]
MKIGLFTDSHYSTEDYDPIVPSRRPLLSMEKIKNALKEFIENETELIICLGDLVNVRENSENELNIFNLKEITKIISDSGIKTYCILGNHDLIAFDSDEFTRLTGIKTAPLTIRQGEDNEDIHIEDIQFVLLDANYSRDGLSYRKGGNDWTDSFIPGEQLEWLKTVLNDANKKVYVFIHQCLNLCGGISHMISNADEIRKILEESGKVRAVYQGHYHKGDYRVINGIEYITLKAMCEGVENSFIILNTEEL